MLGFETDSRVFLIEMFSLLDSLVIFSNSTCVIVGFVSKIAQNAFIHSIIFLQYCIFHATPNQHCMSLQSKTPSLLDIVNVGVTVKNHLLQFIGLSKSLIWRI